MTPEELYERRLRMFGQFVLTLLVEENGWSDDMQQLVEDGAMDIGLIETDENGNYKLTQAN